MELAALVLVNLFLAVLMYLFFSMRFTRALEQARKSAMPAELRDNLRLAVQFIDNSIEFIQDKQQSFYQLVRRGEEISATLREQIDRLEAEPKRRGKRNAASRKIAEDSVPAMPAPSANAARNKSETRLHSAAMDEVSLFQGGAIERKAAPRTGEPPEEAHYADTAIERALGRLGADRLEISPPPQSAESAYRQGMLSRSRESSAPASGGGEAVANVLGRIGGAVMRLMGAEGLRTTAPEASAYSNAPKPAAAPAPRFEIPELPETPAETTNARRRSSVQNQPPPRGDRLELSEAALEPVFHSAPERSAPALRRDVPEETDEGVLERQVEDAIRRGGLADLLLDHPEERAAILRILLSYGYEAGDIARETGASRAELELIASLPGQGRRARRLRL